MSLLNFSPIVKNPILEIRVMLILKQNVLINNSDTLMFQQQLFFIHLYGVPIVFLENFARGYIISGFLRRYCTVTQKNCHEVIQFL